MIRSMTLVLVALAAMAGVHGQSYQYQFGYWSQDAGAETGKMGWSMAVAPPYVVVGLPREDTTGAVLVYEATAFASGNAPALAMLKEGFGAIDDQRFGASVACDGANIAASNCTAIVPAASDHNNPNAPWISLFHHDGVGWQPILRLDRPAHATGLFGHAMAMNDGWLAVGGARAPDGNVVRDVVYLYRENAGTWELKDSLDGEGFTTSDADAFGCALAMDGTTLAVGTKLDDELGVDAGATYIYDRDLGGSEQWGLVRKLLPSNGASGDHFGSSIGVHHERCVVGAPGREQNGLMAGGANVFERDEGFSGNWGETATLSPALPHAEMNFGASVALSSQRIAVGSPTDPAAGNYWDGSVDIFVPDGSGGWMPNPTVVPFYDGVVDVSSRSGTSLAFLEDQLLVGAPYATIEGTARGGVMVYGDPLLGINTLQYPELELWPMPFDAELFLRCRTADHGRLEVFLTDVLGRAHAAQQEVRGDGVLGIQRGTLPAGAYTLVIRDAMHECVIATAPVIASARH